MRWGGWAAWWLCGLGVVLLLGAFGGLEWLCLDGVGGSAFGGVGCVGVAVLVWRAWWLCGLGWFCFWGRLVVWDGCAWVVWIVLFWGALGGLGWVCLGGAFGGFLVWCVCVCVCVSGFSSMGWFPNIGCPPYAIELWIAYLVDGTCPASGAA